MLYGYRRAFVAVAVLALAIVLMPASTDVEAQPAPVEVTQLCRSLISGQLRYVPPHRDCTPGSEVAFNTLENFPYTICANVYSRAMRIPTAAGCTLGELTLVIPDNLPIYFCINPVNGKLTYTFGPTACPAGQFGGTVNLPPPDLTDDAYDSLGNVGIDVANAVNGLFANDNLEGGSLGTFQNPSANGGTVLVNGDGSFEYTPPPGFEGADTFTYTVANAGGSDTATVTITVVEVIWFIDASASGPGTGTLTEPFNSIANFNNLASDAPGDTLFVFEGNYGDTFAGLQNEQQLIGQGVDLLTVTGFVTPPFSRPLPGATANPEIDPGGVGNIVPIANDNLVAGLTLDNATHGVAGLSGAQGTTVDRMTIQNMAQNGVGITPSTNTTITFVEFNNNGTDITLNADTTVIQDISSTASNSSIAVSGIANTLLIERADIDGATLTAGIILDAAQAGSTSTLNDVTIDGGVGGGLRVTNAVAGASIDINNLDIGATAPVGGDSLEFIDNAGDFDVDAASSVTHSAVVSIAFSSDGDSGTLLYNGDITATAGQFMQVLNDTGTKTFQNGTLDANGSDNAFFNNADGFYNFLGTTTMTSTSDGFVIFGSDGDFTMTAATSVVNPTLGYGVWVQGGNADVDYSGSISVYAGGVFAVNVESGHTGVMTFQSSSTINAISGGGLRFDDADGTYNFTGTTTLNGGDAGIDIHGNSNGTFTFGANTSITNPIGDAFQLIGDTTNSPAITYSGTMANNNDDIIEIADTVGPHAIIFDSVAADALQDTAAGIFLNNVGQNVSVIADTELSGTEGIDIDGGAGIFTFADTDITNTVSAPALDIDGGTASVDVQANSSISQNQPFSAVHVHNGHVTGTLTFNGTLNATNGDGLQFNDADGNYNFNVASGTTTLNGGDAGIDLVNFTDGVFIFTDPTITNPSPGPAINIQQGIAATTFNGMDVDTSGTAGLVADSTDTLTVTNTPDPATIDSAGAPAIDLNATTLLAMTFTSVSSANSTAEGIDIDGIVNAASAFTIDDGNAGTNDDATITTTAAGFSGIDIDSSAGTFTFASVDIGDTGDDGVNLNGSVSATVNIESGTIDETTADGINSTATGTLNIGTAAPSGVVFGATTAIGATAIYINSAGATPQSATVLNNSSPATSAVAEVGIALAAAGPGTLVATLDGNDIKATDHALQTGDGGTVDSLHVAVHANTWESGTAVDTLELIGGALGSTVVTSLSSGGTGNTVVANGTNGGAHFDQISFDADLGTAGIQQVAGGATNIGQGTGATQRVQGDGIAFEAPTGDLGFGTLNIFNDGGTGLLVDTKTNGVTFTLGSTGGTTDTLGGPAMFLDPLTAALTQDAVLSDASATGAGLSNGVGVTFDQVAGTVNITTLTVTNPTNEGLFVNGSTGSFTISGGSISGAPDAAVRVDNSGAADTSTLTYDGSITNTAGRSVQIEDKTGGAVNLGGTLDDTGTGVLVQNNSGSTAVDFDGASKVLNTGANQAVTLANNTGATVSFSNGGLDIDTSGSANGFNATGGGTVNVTGAGNSVDTSSGAGVAVNINSTTIGASGVTFERIDADGAPNGIVLNSTGTAGSLSVTGDGGTPQGGNGTGGTIDNTTGAGISLTATMNPAFRNMTIEDTGNHGIHGLSGVNGFTLQYATVQRAGNGNDEHGVQLVNVTGTVLIDNAFMTLAANDLVQILNTDSNATVTVSNSALQETDGSSGLFGNDAISLQVQGTSNVTLNVNSNVFGQASDGLFGNAVDIGNATGGSTPATGTVNFNATGNTSTQNVGDLNKSGSFTVSGQDSLTVNLDLTSNTFTGAKGNGVISIDANDSSTIQGFVGRDGQGNMISNATNSNGITVFGDESANVIVVAEDNSLTNVGTDGIQVANFGGSLGNATDMDVTLRDNTVSGHNGGATPFMAGIDIFGGGAAGGGTCINMDDNAVSGTPMGFFDYALDDFGAPNAMLIQGPGMAAVTVADIQTLNNQPGASVSLFGAINFSNGAACETPP